MSIKVHVDMNLCQSHAECVAVAPDIFDLDDDDVLHWEESAEDSRREELEEAVNVCPMAAIKIEQE